MLAVTFIPEEKEERTPLEIKRETKNAQKRLVVEERKKWLECKRRTSDAMAENKRASGNRTGFERKLASLKIIPFVALSFPALLAETIVGFEAKKIECASEAVAESVSVLA